LVELTALQSSPISGVDPVDFWSDMMTNLKQNVVEVGPEAQGVSYGFFFNLGVNMVKSEDILAFVINSFISILWYACSLYPKAASISVFNFCIIVWCEHCYLILHNCRDAVMEF